MAILTDAQWQQYERDGYLKLGKVLSGDGLTALQERIDAIMLGTAEIDYDRLMMQLDSTDGLYANVGKGSMGHKGATLAYRKIEQLEFDPIFLRHMQLPIYREICARVYGPDAPISAFRAMFMNKPANQGTFLPWHQDRWTDLDRDPLVTIWMGLDPATVENGCVQIIPGSHKRLINPEHPSGFLTEEQAKELCPPEKRVFLTLEAGEVVLLHNWLLHGSDKNRSAQSRRAFSVCYMHGATQSKHRGAGFPIVFGEGALSPDTVSLAKTL